MTAQTVGEAARALEKRFRDAGLDDSRLDARLLVAHMADIAPQDVMLRPDRPLTADQVTALETLAERRLAHEPVTRILGKRGFWTLDLEVTAETLDPRPDTETVVEAVVKTLPDRSAPLRLVDFGTGTGAILLALLAEYPRATGIGIDISAGAIETAGRNAALNQLEDRAEFRLGDWGGGLPEAVDGTFDVVVSNPPYIPETDIDALQPEVRLYDPRRALSGGADGLVAYRILAPLAHGLLKPGGLVALEVGYDQAARVADLLRAAGFGAPWNRADLGGVARCVCALRDDT